MTSLNIVYLLMGVGVGMCIGYVIGVAVRRPAPAAKPDSTIYFGTDVHEHPDDVERQVEGSGLVPAASGAGYMGRGYDHRYDGIADRNPKG